MAQKLSKEGFKNKIREIIQEVLNEMPDDSFVKERKLTPAEEKKKEELVQALKPKYGKTPKTYAIATAKAKELAEDDFDFDKSYTDNKEGEIIEPRTGINTTSKFLAIVYKNDEVDDNEYFDTEDEAQSWIDDCCNENQVDERMMSFPYKKMAPRRGEHNDPRHSPINDLKEDDLEFTDKYDKHPSLKGKQSRLPDQLQKSIINKKSMDEDRMLPHPSIRVNGTGRKHNLPNHAPVTTARKK